MSNEKFLEFYDEDDRKERRVELRKRFQDDKWELQKLAGEFFLEMVPLKYDEVTTMISEGFMFTGAFLEHVDEVKFITTMMEYLEVFGEDSFEIDVYINLKDEKDKKEEDKDEVI